MKILLILTSILSGAFFVLYIIFALICVGVAVILVIARIQTSRAMGKMFEIQMRGEMELRDDIARAKIAQDKKGEKKN